MESDPLAPRFLSESAHSLRNQPTPHSPRSNHVTRPPLPSAYPNTLTWSIGFLRVPFAYATYINVIYPRVSWISSRDASDHEVRRG